MCSGQGCLSTTPYPDSIATCIRNRLANQEKLACRARSQHQRFTYTYTKCECGTDSDSDPDSDPDAPQVREKIWRAAASGFPRDAAF